MSKRDLLSLLTGEILEDDVELSLADLSRISGLPAEQVIELVEEGLIEPRGQEPARWVFRGISVRRVHCAQRLQRDLGVNLAGAALAVELLEEIRRLEARLHRLGGIERR